MQYIQLITDKTNAADLSSSVFAFVIGYPDDEKNTKVLPFHTLCQKLAKVMHKGSNVFSCRTLHMLYFVLIIYSVHPKISLTPPISRWQWKVPIP